MTLLPEAAQNIVAGDIKGAMQLLPGLSRATAAQGYFDAFRNLSRCLAALTAFAALIILALLGKAANPSTATDQSIAPCHSACNIDPVSRGIGVQN
jgi:SLT domain-containing protein